MMHLWLNNSMTDKYVSMKTNLWLCSISLSRTHTHEDTHACWKLQRGRETGLPSTGRKRMKEGGKEKKKEKNRSYTTEQK